jgi:hypothetical protein
LTACSVGQNVPFIFDRGLTAAVTGIGADIGKFINEEPGVI